MGLIRAAIVAVALVALVACGDYTTTIGPLTIKVPEGWQVSDREANNLKLTDGTIGEVTGTKAGTATAVFDIYVDSAQTTKTFLAYLGEQHITPKRERLRVGGSDAELFRYSGTSVGGRQEAVIVPRWRVFILYRAAFRGDDAAFLRGRAAFRGALRSLTFSGSSSAAAGASSSSSSSTTGGAARHGPGKIAITAIAAPVAISTNPT
jgi:hypothetical protein